MSPLDKLVGRSKAAKLAVKIRSLRSSAKAQYAEADQLLAQLQSEVAVGQLIPTKIGNFAVIDNFAVRRTCFKSIGFSRYSLEEV